MDAPEYMESTTVRFEWTVRGLGELFESSKGDSKSKVTKSAKFGGGRWQILFYPNSGVVNSEGQGFVSLYLACEPTNEEKENAVNGKWVREGIYKFGFEMRNLQKTILFNSKEANDHTFSYKTVNWGWAQFARRELIASSNPVRQNDAILIICTITSTPTPLPPPPTILRRPVPRDLLDAMGSLLDDPAYSDIEFVLPRKRGRGKGYRTIYAAGKVLRRVDYFDTMFRSGFAEGLRGECTDLDITPRPPTDDLDDEEMEDGTGLAPRFEDSDDEDDYLSGDETENMELHLPRAPSQTRTEERTASDSWDTMEEDQAAEVEGSADAGEKQDTPHTPRLGTPQPQAPGTRSRSIPLAPEGDASTSRLTRSDVPGPRKIRVVIGDAAYSTYRAVLYYIYTDTIVFAPLASSFHKHGHTMNAVAPSNSKHGRLANVLGASTPAATAPESQGGFQLGHGVKASLSSEAAVAASFPTRREWIAEWERNNPGRPRPCSAKAVYRLADKLDLQDLKQRAYNHIIKSLAVENVAYEVFSDFSAAFEDVRKVEVAFFLDHWGEIRSSEAMRTVWQQIRLGRHPGFEEVWPMIALNLEFRPHDPEEDGRDIPSNRATA